MKLKDKDTLEIDLNKDEARNATYHINEAVQEFANSDDEQDRTFTREVLMVALKALIVVYAEMCVKDGTAKVVETKKIKVAEELC